jgi:hypothetical protein
MTDREALEALLARFGIAPVDAAAKSAERADPLPETAVVLQAHHGGVGGYEGFFVEFEFSSDGRFKGCAVWE